MPDSNLEFLIGNLEAGNQISSRKGFLEKLDLYTFSHIYAQTDIFLSIPIKQLSTLLEINLLLNRSN